jgi:translation initiation factor 2B subunit (eIF-2B alpha/beta/delta family)
MPVLREVTLSTPVCRGLERIHNDRTHGATFLASRALGVVRTAAEDWARLPDPSIPVHLQVLARELRRTQPAMGPFVRWSDELLELARVRPETRVLAGVQRWLRTWELRIRRELPSVVAHAVRYFPPRASVLTISSSDAVFSVLAALPPRNRPQQIHVLRSEPGGEGVGQWRRLRARGLRAALVPDAASTEALRGSNLMLMGADSVFRSGATVHKVGTRELARTARRFHIPVISITGRSKVVDRRAPRSAQLPTIFDLTPGNWISEFWTDTGRIRPDQIVRSG